MVYKDKVSRRLLKNNVNWKPVDSGETELSVNINVKGGNKINIEQYNITYGWILN